MLAFARSARKAAAVRQTREERFLDGVLRVSLVAKDAEREPVRDAADAVVELGERVLVASGDERDQGLVREVGVLLAHREAIVRPGQR